MQPKMQRKPKEIAGDEKKEDILDAEIDYRKNVGATERDIDREQLTTVIYSLVGKKDRARETENV